MNESDTSTSDRRTQREKTLAELRNNPSWRILNAAGLFYPDDEDPQDLDEDDYELPTALNLNDAFFWACSDSENVPAESLKEVADLFLRYGQCGVFYWVLNRRGWDKVEFLDVNRMVEFVRNEERIRQEVKNHFFRLPYHKACYTIGADQT